ncbi:MAG TPA: hypothetical protein DIT28_19410 [Oxalobacteraceae bacterium]|nr:hypothetical protein [Oxalobacteraceae bacterium]
MGKCLERFDGCNFKYREEDIMPQTITINRRNVLNSRPHGVPTNGNFALKEEAPPVPKAGQMQLRTRREELRQAGDPRR